MKDLQTRTVPLLVFIFVLGTAGHFLAGSQEETKIPQRANNQKIELNQASLADLRGIPKLSKRVAKAIIDYRRENGSFENWQQLLDIKGIGPKTLTFLQQHVSID